MRQAQNTDTHALRQHRLELCPLRSREDVFWRLVFCVFFLSSNSTFLSVYSRSVGLRSVWRLVKTIWGLGGGRRFGQFFVDFLKCYFTFVVTFFYDMYSWWRHVLLWTIIKMAVEPLFLLRRDLPSGDGSRYDPLELCLAAERVIGRRRYLGHKKYEDCGVFILSPELPEMCCW